MTTFQDPPPQSRRAVRQSERAEHPDAQQPYTFDPDSPEAAAEAAAEAARANSSSGGGHRADAASHVAVASGGGNAGGAGSRAVDAQSVEAQSAELQVAEPLNYMTQARVHQVPAASAQTASPSPTTEQGPFRVRDYSPEGRRAAISREAFSGVTSTPAAPSAPRPFDRPQPVQPSQVDLDYFTQGAPIAITPPPAAPLVAPVPLVPHAAQEVAVQAEPIEQQQFDHTMTRRELRELRAAQERQAQPRNPEPIDNILNSGPIPIPVLSVLPGQSQALADAMAEFDQLAGNRNDLELPVAAGSGAPAPAPLQPLDANSSVPANVDSPARSGATEQAAPVDHEPPVLQAPPVAPANAAQPFPFRLTAPSATEPPAPAAFVPPPLVEPQRLPTGQLEQALKEPEFASLADIAPTLAAPTEPVLDEAYSPAALAPVDGAPVSSAPITSAPVTPAPITPAPITSAPIIPAPITPVADAAVPVVPAPIEPGAAAPAPVFPPTADAAPADAAPARHDIPVGSADAVFLEPDRTTSKPVGHWSVQAEMDDDDLGLDNTMSRTVGAGTAAITTSALVLPSVPEMGDLLHPFTSTGEILVTGSIDLPRSLGATGAHPHRVDNSDFEDDPLDSEVVSTDSAPVRAIRAISTHTSTRGVIEQKRRQSSRMPAVMIVVASVLALGVVALLAVAFATHLL